MFTHAIVPDIGGPDNNKQDPVLQSVGDMDTLSPKYNPKYNMESFMGEL